MNGAPHSATYPSRWEAVGRFVLIAIATLILSACSSAPRHDITQTGPMRDTLPVEAWTGGPEAGVEPDPDYCGEDPVPLPECANGPWKPPGIGCPWPEDEYLHDGGDRPLKAIVDNEWQIYGLDSEDTLVHYDTVDGRIVVKPSNCVHIYAPRFGAVRQVLNVVVNEHVAGPRGVDIETPPLRVDMTEGPESSLQNVQLNAQIGRKRPSDYTTRYGDGVLSQRLWPESVQDALLPFENLSIIRIGIMDQREKAQLATAVDAAIVWTHDHAPAVMISEQAANAVVAVQSPMLTYRFDDIPGNPCLRLIKVASTQYAKPGDTIDFTLRVDNMGDEVVGNVTIVDSLTTRLEYVPNSAQSSLEAEFSVEPNTAESLILRWDLAKPLQPGEGGIMRFQCRVR